jgi:glycosyltransferase involved in cell wall biosynthesis
MVKLGVFPAYRLYRRMVLRCGVEAQISPSKYMASVHDGAIGGESRHISLGVDLTGLTDQRPARPRRPMRFGFMAGFQPHKGIEDALSAASSLKRRGLNFELHIWGPHQEGRQEELESRGLQDRVFLRGTFTSPQRWAVYMEIDMLLMATTVCEAYGRVAQEAAAAGVPTLAPAIGGIIEQIRDGVDGLLYRFRDVSDLERQMARVIEEPDLVRQLVANLWRVVDTRVAVEAVEQFYFEILARRRARISDVAFDSQL